MVAATGLVQSIKTCAGQPISVPKKIPKSPFVFQVAKNRFDGELGIMLLKFNKDSLSFAVNDKENCKKPLQTIEKSEEGEES